MPLTGTPDPGAESRRDPCRWRIRRRALPGKLAQHVDRRSEHVVSEHALTRGVVPPCSVLVPEPLLIDHQIILAVSPAGKRRFDSCRSTCHISTIATDHAGRMKKPRPLPRGRGETNEKFAYHYDSSAAEEPLVTDHNSGPHPLRVAGSSPTTKSMPFTLRRSKPACSTTIGTTRSVGSVSGGSPLATIRASSVS